MKDQAEKPTPGARRPLDWFSRLPWQTQVTILVGAFTSALLVFARYWVPEMVPLLEALSGLLGKWRGAGPVSVGRPQSL